MKKSIISLIVVLVVISFSFSFAKTFSDVKNTKYEKSVEILTNLKIVDGYQDGTFKPNNTVTRAELAKLIIVSVGKESTADSLKGKTDFSDVPEKNWASGYINCASSMGIIKGYPDGTFKPSNPVSYVEASTMLLRALNYTKELETEKYPTGYMKRANDAGILKNVTANSSTDSAIRGNIANMVVNTLMANTRKIVSTTSNGGATYGDSTPLIEEHFKGYKVVKDGTVSDIDFDERIIVVKDSTNNRKVRAIVKDEEKIEKLYGRKVSFLYDDNEDEFWSFEITDEYTVKEVDVKEIDSKDDVLTDTKGNDYDIPNDVLMAYIYNYDEVETAYILYNGKKITSMVLVGTPKVEVGVVTASSVTIDKRKGFEFLNLSGKYDEIAFSDTSEKVTKNSVVLYSLDNNEYAVIQYEFLFKNAIAIEELTSTSIKLKKEAKINLTSDVEYYVYLVDTEFNISEGKLKDIEEEFDKAEAYKYADVWYIVVFEDTVDDDEIVSKLSVAEAKEQLQDVIKSAEKLLKKESSYSVASFEALKDAVKAGKEALNTSSSAAKLELCARKITDAKNNMKSATSSDKQLRSDFDDLQKLIADAESKKKADFTEASYKALTDEIKNAKAVKLATTTTAKISERYNALNKAINMLVTNTANTEIQNAIKSLNALITKGDAIVKNKADYTDASYTKFNTALTTAKKFDSSKASLAEIKNQASNLEAAIDALEPKLLATYKSTRKTLDDTYKDAIGRKSSNYTKETFEVFEEELVEIKQLYGDLLTADEIEVASNSDIQDEIESMNSIINKIKASLKKLVTVTDETTRTNLRKIIAKGEEYTKDTWDASVISFEELQTKLKNAKTKVDDPNTTEAELKTLTSELISIIPF